jgi:hypothetical protein
MDDFFYQLHPQKTALFIALEWIFSLMDGWMEDK